MKVFINYPGTPLSRVIIHAVLGTIIFPLLAVKIVSARYFKRMGVSFLLFLGVCLSDKGIKGTLPKRRKIYE